MSEYIVIYEQAESGAWGAYLPDAPDLVTLGESRAEIADGIKEALDANALDLRERGLPLPEPHHSSGTIAA